MINLSLLTSTVPTQWKQAYIRPVPKTPTQPADYWPISVTPVLTRMTERIVVQRYIYPTFSAPPPTLQYSDQYAFRPTGSTTAAIIYLLHTVISLLSTEPYVIVLSLDFSKAFDTVRHLTLLQKLAQLDIPDHIYNWLADFLNNHSHSTGFGDELSTLLDDCKYHPGFSHWTSCVRCHCRRPRRSRAGKLAVQIRRRYVRHHPCQQRGLWNSTTCRDGPSRTT